MEVPVLQTQMREDDMARRRPPYDADVEYGVVQTTSADESAFSDYDDAEVHRQSIVDFSSVALYVPGLQTVLALILCCLTSVLTSLASAAVSVSAVRTATLTALVGGLVVCKPIRIAYARGIDVMFDALRPAVAVYVLALIFEQLVHSCGLAHDGSTTLRHWVYHAFSSAMAAAGFVQAWNPVAQTDYPFIVVAISLVAVACFTPPPLRAGEGPLCEAPAMAVAAERFIRALLFGCTYCALAYASEPTHNSVREIMLCVVRATAGSVWVLCIHRFLVVGAVVQALIAVWARLKTRPKQRNADSLGNSLHSDPQHTQRPPYTKDDRQRRHNHRCFAPFDLQHEEAYAVKPNVGAHEWPLEGIYGGTETVVGRCGDERLLAPMANEFARVGELSSNSGGPEPVRDSLRVTLGTTRPSLRPARDRGDANGAYAGSVAGWTATEERRRMELVARQLVEEDE